MLTFLRKRKDSWAVKGVLFFLALIFISFYGSSALRKSLDRPDSPASVNGQEINPQKFSYELKQRLDGMRAYFKDKIPENIVQMTRDGIINNLVNQELLNAELLRLGLIVNNAQLVDFIKDNPQFQENGVFNSGYYLKQFLPGYQLTTGTSYEAEAKRELAVQDLFAHFDKVLSPDPIESKAQHKVNNTKYKFSVVKIAKDPEKTEDAKQKSTVAPQEMAEKILALFKAGADTTKTLESYHLKAKDTGELSVTSLSSVFGGKKNQDDIKVLYGLNKAHPVPEKYFEVDNTYYVVKLLDLKTNSAEMTEEESQAALGKYQERVSTALEAALIKSLRDKAKIAIRKP